MTNLTDLEICKKIAEIEGVPSTLCELDVLHIASFNPLIDKALCFDFIVELGLKVGYTDCPAGSGRVYYCVHGDNYTSYFDTPERAVCMAKLGVFDV